jgi:RluA family pseudouridine synthase
MDIVVLREDEDLIFVDKPPMIVVNRAQTVQGETLQDWWWERYGGEFQVSSPSSSSSPLSERPSMYRGTSESLTDEDTRYFVERCGMVHRLDKETSGVMVFAKTPVAFVELLRQFREKLVFKQYLALTHGIWQAKRGEINLPIARRSDDRKKMGVSGGGRDSLTEYEVVSEYGEERFPKELKVDVRGYQGFSLVSFAPRTGRTHQIRVHARAVGHPLVGDLQYGGRKRSREDRKWSERMLLQADKMSLLHPRTQELIVVKSLFETGSWTEYLA